MSRVEELLELCVLDSMQKSAGLMQDLLYLGEGSQHISPTRKGFGRAAVVLSGLNPVAQGLNMARHKDLMNVARKVSKAEAQAHQLKVLAAAGIPAGVAAGYLAGKQ